MCHLPLSENVIIPTVVVLAFVSAVSLLSASVSVFPYTVKPPLPTTSTDRPLPYMDWLFS